MVIKKAWLRRICVLMLVALLMTTLSVLCSCGEESEIPDGMQSATCAGATYRLYVPTNWTVKNVTGLSGAYVTLSQLSDVTAYVLDVETGVTAGDVWTDDLTSYQSRFADVTETASDTGKLGENDAEIHVFTLTLDETSLKCMHICAVKGTKAFVFLYLANADIYDDYLDDVSEMASVFVCEASSQSGTYYECMSPKDTPEGMTCINDKNVAYYFFVPEDWVANLDDAIVSAKAPNDDTNVSVTVYADTSVYSPQTYLEESQKAYENLAGYTKGQEGETTLAGQKAVWQTFSVTDGDVTYQLYQVATVKNSFLFGPMAYIITYTSTDALYDTHFAEFEAMCLAFRFR